MKPILLIPFGSSGDVHPFIGLGIELKKRGHPVALVTNGFFRSQTERAGIEFIELGTREEYLSTTENPDLWHPIKSFPLLCKHIMEMVPRTVEIIKARRVTGDWVVVAGSLALGARVAQEKWNVPTAMVHLQPAILRSVIDPPRLPLISIPRWFPESVIRTLYRLIDVSVDWEIGRPLNKYRKSLGLAPAKSIMGTWWHSPKMTLALFPDWYYPPPADFPPFVKNTGFPLFDGEGVEQTASGLDEFLAAGPAPVVFTGGSAMKTDVKFFAESVKVCREANIRGILLAQFSDQVPTDLPASVRHFSYVPFGRVFSKAAAIVHHGGIGTVSQCFKSGRPQLVVPLAYDQYDNARRVERLGAGLQLSASRYSAKTAGPLLQRLMNEPSFAQTSKQLSIRINGHAALSETCDYIEKL
jgi:rhamnosyltransferase subunit B